MTPYALLRELCGLSIREAAAFHGVREDTVYSWSAGRRTAPAGAMSELRDLAALIEQAADRWLSAMEAPNVQEAREIEIGYPADDHEAQTLGFPCVGAWRAAAGRMIAETDLPMKLVPRGSTIATAGAIAAREGSD
jgi:hypothetical protein